MLVKRLLGVWALALASQSCGDGGSLPNTSLDPLLPEEGAAVDDVAGPDSEEEGGDTAVVDDGTAPEPASCDPADCPEMLLFGVLVPGCCRFGNLCGGQVQVSERTWACLAPEVNEQGEELQSALTLAAREPFVADAACPSHEIDGDELSGCCRAGECGVDTEPWTRSAAAFGLVLPRACLDPRHAAELAEVPPSGATPPPCRD